MHCYSFRCMCHMWCLLSRSLLRFLTRKERTGSNIFIFLVPLIHIDCSNIKIIFSLKYFVILICHVFKEYIKISTLISVFKVPHQEEYLFLPRGCVFLFAQRPWEGQCSERLLKERC